MGRGRRKHPDTVQHDAGHNHPPGEQQGWLLAALIVGVCGVTTLVHWPALSARAWSFDDTQYVLKNPLVLNPSWESARRVLAEILEPSTVGGYYQPLAMISLMLDTAQGGSPENLRPYHRTSLILHVVNTAGVIVLLFMLFESAVPAVAVGLLFGVHPLTVEPIPWLGERKTVLAALFALICFILYVAYARRDERRRLAGAASSGRGLYLAALLTFILALMSKPTTTPIPVLLLLLDYWPLNRLSRRAVLEKIPFFVVAGVSAVITVISQARTASVTLPGERPAGWVPLTLCHNIVFYLRKIVWPAGLSSHYPFPEPFSLSHPSVLAGVIGTGLLTAILLVSWRRTRALITGWVFFFVAIFPTLGVIGFTDVIASDKFAYLPSVGLLILLAWGIARGWGSGAAGTGVAPRRAVIALFVLVAAVAESNATRRYLSVWQDTDRYWQHMIALAPRVAMLHVNYAGYLLEAGRIEEAREQAQEGLELDPTKHAAHNALGASLMRLGRPQEALPYFAEALRIHDTDYVIHTNLAAAFAKLGRDDRAMEHYAIALRLKPTSPELHYNLAGALARKGELGESAQYYAEAARLNPRWAEPYERLGVLLAGQGRLEEAVASFGEAVRLRPIWPEARKSLGAALAQLNRLDEAIEQYEAALRLDPALADVHFNLANALLLKDRPVEAIAHYREAVRLRPEDAEAHVSLARALVRQGEADAAIAAYSDAVRAKPDSAEAHNDLGVLLAQRGRLQEAVAHFQEAVRLRPDWAEARKNLALASGQGTQP